MNEADRRLIVSCFRFYVEQGEIEVGAFVVMTDHFYILLSLAGRWTVGQWMHALMSYVGAKTGARLRSAGSRWQKGFYETEIWAARQFNFMVDYIHYNPVRAGLVKLPEEWEASSACPHSRITLTW